ncbi:MAG: glycosyltransferase family 4 protein [Sediminibacterium sp.]|nr:glycosyltransferase family 4 protein [Sediminibacterium sp.]
MEIIHIILGKANPERLNGVNKVVYHLATEQTKAGRNVNVWGITNNPVHDYPKREFTTRLFKSCKNPFSIHPELKKSVIAHKHAVFHLHGGWIPAFSSLSKLFAKHTIKFVLTPHGAYNTLAIQKNRIVKNAYFRLFEKGILDNAYKIHNIGKSEVEGLRKIHPNASSFLMPYGFDISLNTKPSLQYDTFTIGFVGRLDIKTKGIDLLLNSFKTFNSEHPTSRLWLIGDGNDKKNIEKYIRANGLKNVTLWGKKFGEEKTHLISQMHAFAHPSRNEGLPNAVLEAAVMGVPSVVTTATNVAEYIDAYNAGISIANESHDELVNAFKTIHFDFLKRDLHKYTENTSNMLQDVFAWPALVKKFDELYQ